MSYATLTDFTNSYRETLLCDLTTDGQSSRPQTLTSNPTNQAIAQAALDEGAGIINSAAIWGQRYTPDQLAALTDDDLAFLVGLNTSLAYWILLKRVGKGDEAPYETQNAFAILDKLRSGERLFNVPEDVSAAQQTINFPTAQTYATVNLLRDYCGKAYPIRQKQQPYPQ